MKKPIAIIFNDVHLKNGNEEEVLVAFRYMVEKAKELGIKRTIFAGDLFDSRTMQRLKVLQTFDIMLDELHQAGMTVDLISGNHDKTIYASYDSFLESYRYHPGVSYYRGITELEYSGVKFTYLPFFSDDMLIPMLEESKGGDVLISHFEMAGSTNLGRTSEKTSINQKLLSKWKKVYLGHYHNWHEISKDIVHLPSFVQANFGEDSNKGFTVLYDDLSYELIQGRFKHFTKVVIDLNKDGIIHIKSLIKQHKNSEDAVRFEFIGEDSKLKALDKSIFKDTGINVTIKYESKYETEDVETPKIIEHYDKEQVRDSFKDFCDKKNLKHEEGLELLDEFLKQ
tara:strand:+ start:187 stop:1206 length:1020 start_codon:yes stop_codon:yes gene_type:complete